MKIAAALICAAALTGCGTATPDYKEAMTSWATTVSATDPTPEECKEIAVNADGTSRERPRLKDKDYSQTESLDHSNRVTVHADKITARHNICAKWARKQR